MPCPTPTQAPDRLGGGDAVWGEVECAGNPFDRDVLGEGAEVGESKEISEVEQLLLNGHKKSDTRRLVSDFLGTPSWTQMLK
ncbi:hypothetical protein D3C80_1870720 [compost metagenome]